MYRIDIQQRPSVLACYDSMPERQREQIDKRIRKLAARGPSTKGVRKLKGSNPPRYRYRCGDYRVIFSVAGAVLTILEIVNRKDAYKER